MNISDMYSKLIETANDAIFIADAETGNIIDLNKKACELLDMSEEEIKGMHQSELHPPEESERYQEIFSRHIQKGRAIEEPLYVVNKTGMRIPVEISANVLDFNGRKIIQGVFRDVTERKNMEDALKTSEEKYRLLFEHEQDAVFLVDVETYMIIDANNAALQIYGYSMEEMLNMTGYDISAEPEKSIAAIKKTATGSDKMYYFIREHKKKDGTVFPVEISAGTFMLKDRRMISVVIRDITERKKAKLELLNIAKGVSNAGEKFFVSLVQHLADVLSIDYAYIAEIRPYKPEYAKTLSFFVDGKIIDNIEVNISNTPCEEVSQNGHCSCTAGLQKHFPSATVMAGMNVESYFGIRLSDSSGKPIGLLAVMSRKPVENIRRTETMLRIFGARASAELERLHAEEELKKYQDNLEQMIEERTSELDKQKTALEKKNTLLQKIQEEMTRLNEYLQNIREDERSRIARELHDELGQSLTALKIEMRLLAKKLDLEGTFVGDKFDEFSEIIESTINSVRKIVFELRPAALDDIGLQVAMELQVEEFKKHTGIDCNITFDSKIRELKDEHATVVFRIFQETLTNVARHAQATKVSGFIRLSDGNLRFQVSDNGIGFLEESISNKNNLGIIGMKERVKNFGGEIKIESIMGQGATVSIRVPLST